MSDMTIELYRVLNTEISDTYGQAGTAKAMDELITSNCAV